MSRARSLQALQEFARHPRRLSAILRLRRQILRAKDCHIRVQGTQRMESVNAAVSKSESANCETILTHAEKGLKQALLQVGISVDDDAFSSQEHTSPGSSDANDMAGASDPDGSDDDDDYDEDFDIDHAEQNKAQSSVFTVEDDRRFEHFFMKNVSPNDASLCARPWQRTAIVSLELARLLMEKAATLQDKGLATRATRVFLRAAGMLWLPSADAQVASACAKVSHLVDLDELQNDMTAGHYLIRQAEPKRNTRKSALYLVKMRANKLRQLAALERLRCMAEDTSVVLSVSEVLRTVGSLTLSGNSYFARGDQLAAFLRLQQGRACDYLGVLLARAVSARGVSETDRAALLQTLATMPRRLLRDTQSVHFLSSMDESTGDGGRFRLLPALRLGVALHCFDTHVALFNTKMLNTEVDAAVAGSFGSLCDALLSSDSIDAVAASRLPYAHPTLTLARQSRRLIAASVHAIALLLPLFDRSTMSVEDTRVADFLAGLRDQAREDEIACRIARRELHALLDLRTAKSIDGTSVCELRPFDSGDIMFGKASDLARSFGMSDDELYKRMHKHANIALGQRRQLLRGVAASHQDELTALRDLCFSMCRENKHVIERAFRRSEESTYEDSSSSQRIRIHSNGLERTIVSLGYMATALSVDSEGIPANQVSHVRISLSRLLKSWQPNQNDELLLDSAYAVTHRICELLCAYRNCFSFQEISELRFTLKSFLDAHGDLMTKDMAHAFRQITYTLRHGEHETSVTNGMSDDEYVDIAAVAMSDISDSYGAFAGDSSDDVGGGGDARNCEELDYSFALWDTTRFVETVVRQRRSIRRRTGRIAKIGGQLKELNKRAARSLQGRVVSRMSLDHSTTLLEDFSREAAVLAAPSRQRLQKRAKQAADRLDLLLADATPIALDATPIDHDRSAVGVALRRLDALAATIE